MMPDEEDHAPLHLPSIISEIDGLPLPPAVKRSLWKSVGRCIGSATDLVRAAFEHGAARIEAKTDAIRATAEARRIVKLEMAKKVPDLIVADEALSNRAVAYLGHEMLIEQTNRESILRHAIEDLRSEPPQEGSQDEIDDDWLHTFMKEASTKSSSEMQAMFGKILSGEIKSPGTFSLKSIRTLGIMDQSTAKEFEQLCNLSIGSPKHFMKVISLSGQPQSNSLEQYGLKFDALNNLNENDLIYGDFNIGHKFDTFAQARVQLEYAGHGVWLEPKDITKLHELSRASGVVFSKVGMELRQIVSMRPDPLYTTGLIEYFEASGCELMKILDLREDGSLIGKPYRDFT